VKKEFRKVGAFRIANAFAPEDWAVLLEKTQPAKAGTRLHGLTGLKDLVGKGSAALCIAEELLGDQARPVRVILFNKSKAHNWPLGWHQDRTIAVARRHELPGFDHWTVKQNIQHVEPPFDLIAKMVTLRLHLDRVDANNAPLRVAPGSHRKNLIPESDYSAVVETHGEMICLAEAGDIWAYSTPILHASRAADSPSRRRVVQVDYAAAELPRPLEWAGI
jgi:ectoine hydroxylase-related dioxygenase (phytanoyl-CoA dioxygenase family)